MPLWWAAVEKPWFLFFLLDVGDGLFGSVCSGALASAGAASRQGSRMETNENGAVLAALDGGALVWRTGVRSKKQKMPEGLEQASTAECSVVSFQSDLPQPLQQAMTQFIEGHPNWDQYRLVQAALAGFLVQNGKPSREITRVYVGNMFRRESLLNGV